MAVRCLVWSDAVADAHIDIDVVGVKRVRRGFARLIETGQDTDSILRGIGQHLLNATKDRFATETFR